MEEHFPHSQEDFRAIQDSFQRYLAPDDLLQAANSTNIDIFKLFFEALEELKVDLESYKSSLRGKVPPHYQQDLKQACALSAGAVAMETSTSTKEEQMPGTHTSHVTSCISACIV